MNKPEPMTVEEAIIWMAQNPDQEVVAVCAGKVNSAHRYTCGYGFQYSNPIVPQIWNWDYHPLSCPQFERYVKKDYHAWQKFQEDINSVPKKNRILDFVKEELAVMAKNPEARLSSSEKAVLRGIERYIEQRLEGEQK